MPTKQETDTEKEREEKTRGEREHRVGEARGKVVAAWEECWFSSGPLIILLHTHTQRDLYLC